MGAVDGRGTFIALFLMGGGRPRLVETTYIQYVNMYSSDWGCWEGKVPGTPQMW